jgi:protein-disulfide isomerase
MSRLLLPIRSMDYVRGPEDPPYTLVEYGDYECSDCGRLYVILRDLQRDIASRLRIVFQHYPLSGGHRQAQQAARLRERRANSEKCTHSFSSGKGLFGRKI